MREGAFVFRSLVLSGRPSEKFHRPQQTTAQSKHILLLTVTFLSKVKVAQVVSVINSSTPQDLTPPLCHNVHSVCIHQLFVHFFMFLILLRRGVTTLALYIAWYSEESAENIWTDLLKCFLCTSL